VTPPEIITLRAAADEAEGVHTEKTDAFEVELTASIRLLALATSAVRTAFSAIAVRQRFFSEEPLLVVPVASKTKNEESRKLYLTSTGSFLEATYAYRAGAWALVGLSDATYAHAVEYYEVEKLVATLTRLCAGVASGNALKRADEARARAERLRAVAVILESIVGGAK
jgi:hypothetical protein